MTNLPNSYVDAIMQNHAHAFKINDYVDQARDQLAANGIELSYETLRAMADDAWVSYVKQMQ